MVTDLDTWRTAFAKQARSDVAVFDTINRHPLCQQLHYLQMATEKLAKAYLTPRDGTRPPVVHKGFVRFVQLSRHDRRLQRASGMGSAQFGEHVKELAKTAGLVEDLAPTKDINKPNPEYPWEANGTVIAPVDYPFVRHQLDPPRMVKLLQFVRRSLAMV